ncbi:MAG: ASCH domain-containing protein [Acidobacteria bacterium]|nr:ASCH domain-containing protein [Acidobacteriota bacterium]
MLIKDEILERIKNGEITLLFRRWSRPGAKAGGTQMTQGGVIGIDSVDVVEPNDITEMEAREAGFPSVADLLAHLSYRDDPIYRIRIHFAGEDPRIALRENADLSETEIAEIIEKLRKLDKNSKRGQWTQQYLQLIHDHPATYSGVLAKIVGVEIPQFKPWVRKLKALGLTESLERGYRLSPRGEKVLEDLRQKHDR